MAFQKAMISDFFIKFTVKWTKKEKNISSISKANRTSVHKEMKHTVWWVQSSVMEGIDGNFLLFQFHFFSLLLPNQDYATQLYPVSVAQETPIVDIRSYSLAWNWQIYLRLQTFLHSPISLHFATHNSPGDTAIGLGSSKSPSWL